MEMFREREARTSKTDEFSEKFRRGGGSFSIKGYLTMKTATFEGFVASLKNLQYNFPKMGGGSKVVWNFSENSSVLEEVGIPKKSMIQNGFIPF